MMAKVEELTNVECSVIHIDSLQANKIHSDTFQVQHDQQYVMQREHIIWIAHS